MTIRVGINGFGRIGRCVLRALADNHDIHVPVINNLTTGKTLAHLYKYDSVHGICPQTVESTEHGLRIDGQDVALVSVRSPAEIPWKKYNVDIVLECTGIFTEGSKAEGHLHAGAKKVIISAPAKNIHRTIVMGVNEKDYNPSTDHIVSNGSCTTNCLAPLTKVVHQNFGVKRGLMTTIHSYTNDQNVLDLPHKDLRRARAAALSMIPTSTGAAKAIAEVIPELKGKLHGMAVRVPTPNVSLVDVTFEVEKHTSAEEVNAAFKHASQTSLKNILGFSEEPLVSCDFNGNPLSSIIDAEYTTVMEGNMLKVLSWYDNEWGFSQRMIDLIRIMA